MGEETIRCSAAAPKPSKSAYVELTAGRWMIAHISVAGKWGAHDNGSVVCFFVGLCLRSGGGRDGVCPSLSMPEFPLWLLDIQTTPDASPRAESSPRQGLPL